MPRIGSSSTPTDPPQQPASVFNDDGNIEVTEDQLRAAAAQYGMDYDGLNDDEREFIASYAAAYALDEQAAARGDQGTAVDPNAPPATNPLIPTEDDDSAATTGDVSTPEAGTESESGSESSPGGGPEAGAAPGDGTATVPPIPSPLSTPPVPPLPTPGPLQPAPAPQLSEEEQALLEAHREGLFVPQWVDPNTGAPITFDAQGNVVPQLPPIPGIEDMDPDTRGAVEFLYSQQQQQAIAQQQFMAAQLETRRAAMTAALEDGVRVFRESTGLTEEQVESMLSSPATALHFRTLAEQYPGDPRSAVQHALTTAYWQDETIRNAAIEAEIQRRMQANQTVEEKKAAQAGLGGSAGSGSIPREMPVPTTREGRDAAMVAVLEQELRGSRGNGQQ